MLIAMLISFAGCSTLGTKPGAFLAKEQKHYDRLGIAHQTAIWEDGLRSIGKENTYEWWYTDSEYEDGTKIVVIFYTKKYFDVKGPAHPTASIEITYPDGKYVAREVLEEQGKLINASKEKCDVRISNSFIRYENGNYHIRFQDDVVTFEGVMKPRINMWRPATGHMYFGKNEENLFAWFVAVPSADVNATLAIGNKTTIMKGQGYHDHNWGNIRMENIFNHWYWSRVAFDDYTVIACDLISEKKFGYTRIPLIMIARGDKIITDDEETLQIIRENTIEHPTTKKFIDHTLTFIQKTKEGANYRLKLDQKTDLRVVNLLDYSGLSPFKIRLAKIIGANPTYIRMAGNATLEIEKDGAKETKAVKAIWEQMFFGKNTEAIIHDYRQ